MMNKMGIKANLDEARVLVASADAQNHQRLFLNEFMDLILSQNEALNVDLSKLKSSENPHPEIKELEEGNQIMDDLRANVGSTLEFRNMCQWKFFI